MQLSAFCNDTNTIPGISLLHATVLCSFDKYLATQTQTTDYYNQLKNYDA